MEFRVDRFGIIHVAIGKASFDDDKLRDNFAALMDAIVRAKPQAAKGTYVKTVTVAATMGPGVRVDPVQADARGIGIVDIAVQHEFHAELLQRLGGRGGSGHSRKSTPCSPEATAQPRRGHKFSGDINGLEGI